MDASALLKAQGWRGKGFSLHPNDNSIGLAKPLLISRNTDGRGIGQKPHVTSDQWWLHAFDQKLKGLDTSKKGAVTQSVTKGQLDVVVATGKSGRYMGVSGLYSSFVSGGLLEGTKPPATEAETSTDATPVTSSSEGEGSLSNVSGNKKSRKSSREGETREERRMRREARRLRKAQKATKKAAAEKGGKRKSAEKVAKKEAKRARKGVETKEDRRARKTERRARKEAKRSRRAEAPPPKG